MSSGNGSPRPGEALKMAGLAGGRRGAPQGVIVDLTQPPQNRAQRRYMRRLGLLAQPERRPRK